MDLDFNVAKIEGFDWDKGNLEHIKKHNVLYKECEEIFFNTPLLVNEDKTHSQKEKRLQALGETSKGRLLFIVFTIRKDKIRVISAREQNKKERVTFQELGGENL